MFVTGKQYSNSVDYDNECLVIKVLHHTDLSAHVRVIRSPVSGSGNEYCYPQTAYKGGEWKEYKEPKIETKEAA